MKNLANILLVLAAGVGYVASLPAGGHGENQVRAYYDGDIAHAVYAREPKKNKGGNAAAATAGTSPRF